MCIQLLVVSFLLLSENHADAYEVDQFYSFNTTKDQQVAGPVSPSVALSGKFQFNLASKSYISVSHTVFALLRLWLLFFASLVEGLDWKQSSK